MATLMLLAALIGLGAPKTLRYSHVVGAVTRYSVTEDSSSTQQAGTSPAVTVSTQASRMTLERRALSTSAKSSTLEETVVEGTRESKGQGGPVTSVIQPVTRVMTLTHTGKVLKLERKAPPGIAAGGRQFLDNLSFELPAAPVEPGAAWTLSSQCVGLDDKLMLVKYTSKYLANTKVGGLACAKINVKFSAPIVAKPKTGPAVKGTVSGEFTYFFSPAKGMDVSTAGSVALEINSEATVNGKQVPLKTVQTTKVVQTLKQ